MLLENKIMMMTWKLPPRRDMGEKVGKMAKLPPLRSRQVLMKIFEEKYLRLAV